MNINGIGSGNAAAWAQFVKAAHAARERNSGLGFEGAGAVRTAQNVYSPPSKIEMNAKTVGVNFDAYA